MLACAAQILFDGTDLLAASPRELRALRGAGISMVFQEPMSSLNPVFSVGFQIGEVLREHLGLSRRAGARARRWSCCGRSAFRTRRRSSTRYPFQLSGGQQQRVMIAMAIACEPKLLIADEPTTALDVTVQKQILELIAELQARRRMAMLFITHDLALVAEIADQVVVMREGEIREQGSGRAGIRRAARRATPRCCSAPGRAARRVPDPPASRRRCRSCSKRAASPRASTAYAAGEGRELQGSPRARRWAWSGSPARARPRSD